MDRSNGHSIHANLGKKIDVLHSFIDLCNKEVGL